MKITLIHNPSAGNEAESEREMLLNLLKIAGHEADYYSTKSKNWRKGLDAPGEIVAVAGGDGTVRKVTLSLLDKKVPIALLPTGTANNIATTLGIKGTAFDRLISQWPKAPRIDYNVGTTSGPWGSSLFIESVGFGFIAGLMAGLDADTQEILDRMDAEEKKGEAQRLLRAQLLHWPARELKVSLDGQDFSGKYLLLEAMNIQCVGPNVHLAPDADPSDGLFNVVLVTEEDRDKLMDLLPLPPGPETTSSRLTIRQGKALEIESKGMDIHVDDEATAGEKLAGITRIGFHERTIQFIVPA